MNLVTLITYICILWDKNSDRNPTEAEILRPDGKSRRDDEDGLNLTKDDDFLGEEISHSTPSHQILRYGFIGHFVSKSYKILIRLGMIVKLGMIIICCLLLFYFCLTHTTTPLSGEGGAINGTVDNVPKVLQYILAEPAENPRGKYTEFPSGKFGANLESSSSDDKPNSDLLERTCSCPPIDIKVKPPNIQVFINFRGDQLRKNFIGYLVDALRRSEINVFIDNHERRGEDLNSLFKRIEDSGIAIVVFSSRYTESDWCLNELVKIKERVYQGLLKVLPIYYKVTPTNVKRLKGEFGDYFRDKEYIYASEEPKIKQWKEAITYVSHRFGMAYDEKSSTMEIDFLATIVMEVLQMLQSISTVDNGQSSR